MRAFLLGRLAKMDASLPPETRSEIQTGLERSSEMGVDFHALRTRQSGARQFVSIHALVPGLWTVHRGHQFLERIEVDLRGMLPNATIFTHLESRTIRPPGRMSAWTGPRRQPWGCLR